MRGLYGLYKLNSARSRAATLVCTMLDGRAAELEADRLCATFGYAAVVVVSFAPAEHIPDSIPVADRRIVAAR